MFDSPGTSSRWDGLPGLTEPPAPPFLGKSSSGSPLTSILDFLKYLDKRHKTRDKYAWPKGYIQRIVSCVH